MTDLVSARFGTHEDIALTATFVVDNDATIRNERGGRWHLDHDRDSRQPLARHQQAVDRDDACLVVGCIDGNVVGHGLALLSGTVTGQLCMIDELIVHPDARAIGVGSAILDHIRSWAREHDCEAIESQVLPGNRAAKNFFERVGMKTRKMRVSADLT